MINVMVCVNEPLILKALHDLFRSSEDISFTLPTGSDLPSMTRQALSGHPDVLLVAADAVRDWAFLNMVRRTSPETRVVLWLHELTAELACLAVERGIRGILPKTSPPETILQCVRAVYNGDLWFETGLPDNYFAGRSVRLAPRESELLTLVSQGLNNREIATAMLLKPGTVKVYISRLFEKIGVIDRLDLILFALRNAEPRPDGSGVLRIPAGKRLFVVSEAAPEFPRTRVERPSRVLAARSGQ